MNNSDKTSSSVTNPSGEVNSLVRQYPWAVFIVPFMVFMLLASFEPQRVQMVSGPAVDQTEQQLEMGWKWFGRIVGGTVYPIVYSVRLLLTLAVMLLLYQGYRQFPLKISPWSIVVGVVGIVVWVGLCKWNLEQKCVTYFQIDQWLAKVKLAWILDWFFESGERPAYNPFAELANHFPLLIGFLVIRFIGLAAIVPIIEEFILRGFIVRVLVAPEWWKVSVGHTSRLTILTPAIYGFLTHPEHLAAIVWFSLVTLLLIRTKNIWDCVVAHAITNFLLGIYVITSGDWALW